MGKPREVVINNVKYPSIKEAALAFGVSLTAIYKAIKEGRADNYFPKQVKNKSKGKEKVVIDGVEYPSFRSAEIAIYGKYTGRLTARKMNGRDMTKSTLKGNKKEVVSSNGTVYESRAAFARAAGLDPSSIVTRVQRGSLMAENPLTQHGKKPVKRIEVEYDGIVYDSIKSARVWLKHGNAWFHQNARLTSIDDQDIVYQKFLKWHTYEIEFTLYQDSIWDEDRIIMECDRRMKKLFAHGKLIKEKIA